MRKTDRAARKGWLLALGVLAFTCGLWGAGWTACVDGYYNCTLPNCTATKLESTCVQAQGFPNCECCQYQTIYFDCNGDGQTDCVSVILMGIMWGDFQCYPSSGGCGLQYCQQPPGVLPPKR